MSWGNSTVPLCCCPVGASIPQQWLTSECLSLQQMSSSRSALVD